MMQMHLTERTHELARAALALHRLAKAAEDVQHLKSPGTPSRPEDGIPRPTEDAALCMRRSHVSETAHDLTYHLDTLAARLEHALDVWEGQASP